MAYDKTTDLESVQADVLTTDMTSNTKVSKLKQLKTESKVPTKAINALNEQLNNAQASASDALVNAADAKRMAESALRGSGAGGGTAVVSAASKCILTWEGFVGGTLSTYVLGANQEVYVPIGVDAGACMPTDLVNVTFTNSPMEERVPLYWDTTTVDNHTVGDYTATASAGNGYSFTGSSASITVHVVDSLADSGHVLGIVLAKTGGREGTWVRVDGNCQPIDFVEDANGVFAGMHTTVLDGKQVVEIPPAYVKAEVLEDGEYAGCQCWWIADHPAVGFHLHPAFMYLGHQARLYVCAYLTIKDSTGHALPANGGTNVKNYFVNTDYDTAYANAMTLNTSAENSGWHMYDVYEHHLLARMMLIEYGVPVITPDTPGANQPATNAYVRSEYRGVYDYLGIYTTGSYDAQTYCWIAGIGRMVAACGGCVCMFDNKGFGKTIDTKIAHTDGTPVTMRMDKGEDFDFGDIFWPDEVTSTSSAGSFGDATAYTCSAGYRAYVSPLSTKRQIFRHVFVARNSANSYATFRAVCHR